MNKHKEKIKLWIETFIVPIRSSNYGYNHSSHALKHYCERMIDEYVSNDEMKECMKENGFLPSNWSKLNWHFKISSSQADRLRELSFQYNQFTSGLRNIDEGDKNERNKRRLRSNRNETL